MRERAVRPGATFAAAAATFALLAGVASAAPRSKAFVPRTNTILQAMAAALGGSARIAKIDTIYFEWHVLGVQIRNGSDRWSANASARERMVYRRRRRSHGGPHGGDAGSPGAAGLYSGYDPRESLDRGNRFRAIRSGIEWNEVFFGLGRALRRTDRDRPGYGGLPRSNERPDRRHRERIQRQL